MGGSQTASVGQHDQRERVDIRGHDQPHTNEHRPQGHHRARPVMIGEVAGERGEKEGQLGDHGKENRRGGMTDVELRAIGLRKTPKQYVTPKLTNAPRKAAITTIHARGESSPELGLSGNDHDWLAPR